MKASEVPQDDKNLLAGMHEPCYAIDENGHYKMVPSLGWEPKNIVLHAAWNDIQAKVEEARQLVQAGKLSPVAYYMERNMMDKTLLAQYLGISRWRLRRHLKPRVFNKLPDETLAAYAKVFNISVQQLQTIA